MDSVLIKLSNESADFGGQIDTFTSAFKESPKMKILRKQGMASSNITQLLMQKKLMKEIWKPKQELREIKKKIEGLMEVSKILDKELMQEMGNTGSVANKVKT